MTAELDGVRPGESSRCGALLEKKEVANNAQESYTSREALDVLLQNKFSMF